MTKKQKIKGLTALQRIKKISLLLFCIIVLSGVIFNLESLKADNIKRNFVRLASAFNSTEDVGGEITYTEDAGMKIERFKDGVAVVTSDKLRVFDSSGIEFYSGKTIMANPCVDATDSRILVYDRDARSMGVYTSFANLCQIKTDYEIISASMNDFGYISVATQADGYKSMVTVYNANFKETYKYYCADGYVLNTDIYGAGKMLAISSIEVNESGSFCRISAFDTSMDTPLSQTEIKAGFVFDVEFINKSKLLAIADTGWYLIDVETGNIVNSREYSSASLLGYSIDGADGAFVYNANGNLSQLKIYDFLADTSVSADISGKVRGVAANDGKIAVLTSGSLLSFDQSGKLLNTIQTNEKLLVDIYKNSAITAHSGGISYIELE